jgi:hypothetical protein
MEIAEIRRARLKQWFANRTLPEKEKSYLSQLMSGKATPPSAAPSADDLTANTTKQARH